MSFFRQRARLIFSIVLLAAISPALPAQVPAPGEIGPQLSAPEVAAPQPPAAEPENDGRGLDWLVTALVLENIPHQYEERKNWGHTTEIFDGLHVWRDGLQIKTKRRTKPVNDGTWQLFQLSLVDPAHQFRVQIENMRDAGGGRAGFDAVLTARVDALGRLSQWETGVQLISLSVEAEAVVQLRISCLVGMSLDTRRLPPDVVLRPEVTAARLSLQEFRVHRISKLGGPLARELSSSLREVVERKLESKQGKIVEKINAQISKHPERLRLSLADMLSSQWKELARFGTGTETPPTTGQ